MRALKKKNAAEVFKAFGSILKDSQMPVKIFLPKSFEALIKKHSIGHFAKPGTEGFCD